MSTKKVVALCMAVALIASALTGVTIAYLTDTDTQINVMTVGKVDIKLIEQQRAYGENGVLEGLEDFEQNKLILPSYGSAQGGKDIYGLPSDITNYVDKIITVENTGANDAYVRVLVAFPAGLDAEKASDMPLHWNEGNAFIGSEAVEAGKEYANADNEDSNNWDVEGTGVVVTIDGNDYNIYSFTRTVALEPGEETPSACVVGFYLDPNVDFDGVNYTMNGKVLDYDFSEGIIIPVVAQAVQAQGFKDAEEAFDASFGDVETGNNPWVNSGEGKEYKEAGAKYSVNEIVILADDATSTDAVTATNGVTVNITGGYYDAGSKDCAVWAHDGATVNIYDGTFVHDGTEDEVTSDNHPDMIYAGATAANTKGTINIYGGFFYARGNSWLLNESDGRGEIVVYGGTFVNWNPADNVSEGAGTSFVPAGYTVVSETQANGDIWYTVVAE